MALPSQDQPGAEPDRMEGRRISSCSPETATLADITGRLDSTNLDDADHPREIRFSVFIGMGNHRRRRVPHRKFRLRMEPLAQVSSGGMRESAARSTAIRRCRFTSAPENPDQHRRDHDDPLSDQYALTVVPKMPPIFTVPPRKSPHKEVHRPRQGRRRPLAGTWPGALTDGGRRRDQVFIDGDESFRPFRTGTKTTSAGHNFDVGRENGGYRELLRHMRAGAGNRPTVCINRR